MATTKSSKKKDMSGVRPSKCSIAPQTKKKALGGSDVQWTKGSIVDKKKNIKMTDAQIESWIKRIRAQFRAGNLPAYKIPIIEEILGPNWLRTPPSASGRRG